MAATKPKRRKLASTHLVEFMPGVTGARINVDKRMIFHVAVLGAESKNGRRYTDAALNDAARVFEGSRVFANHRTTEGGRVRPHKVQEYVGRLTGLYVTDGKVRAREFEVINEGFWPLLQAAQKDPNAMGLSIDGQGKVVRGEVLSVTQANSVDLVPDPATNKGLFEDVHLMEPAVPGGAQGAKGVGRGGDGGGSSAGSASTIVTLIFDKKRFTKAQARAWAKENDFRASGIDETEDSFRIRQANPAGFKRMRTKQLRPGIKVVIGFTEATDITAEQFNRLVDVLNRPLPKFPQRKDKTMDWDDVTVKGLEENTPEIMDELRESYETDGADKLKATEKERDELKAKLAEQDGQKETVEQAIASLKQQIVESNRRAYIADALRERGIAELGEHVQTLLGKCDNNELIVGVLDEIVATKPKGSRPRSTTKPDNKHDLQALDASLKEHWAPSRSGF